VRRFDGHRGETKASRSPNLSPQLSVSVATATALPVNQSGVTVRVPANRGFGGWCLGRELRAVQTMIRRAALNSVSRGGLQLCWPASATHTPAMKWHNGGPERPRSDRERARSAPPGRVVDRLDGVRLDGWGVVWVVSGHNGENAIRAEGSTESAAWRAALDQARTLGMLGTKLPGQGGLSG
jgi:hypothetical protein